MELREGALSPHFMISCLAEVDDEELLLILAQTEGAARPLRPWHAGSTSALAHQAWARFDSCSFQKGKGKHAPNIHPNHLAFCRARLGRGGQ